MPTTAQRYGQLRWDFIYSHIWIVNHVINKMKPSMPVLDWEDHVQAGIIGLIEAAERFDPNRGVQFRTFAFRRVMGEIIDQIRKMSLLSRADLKVLKELKEQETESEEGSGNTIADILVASGKYQPILELWRASRGDRGISLDGSISGCVDDESLDASEVIGSLEHSPETIYFSTVHPMKAIRYQLLTSLPDRERSMAMMYYFGNLSLKAIAEKYGVTESRVCQIMGKTRKMLKEKMTAMNLGIDDFV